MTTEHYRQGDLLFERVDALPKGTERANTKVILEGEATGHKHQLLDGQILLHRPQWHVTEMFLVIPSEGRIIHEEHATIILPHGVYKVRRQIEYRPWGNLNVMD